ncbi:O-antigen ligase family protein [Cupriavidus basilensis]|uniref:O-antigen ligase family protein n=1 Tax=Cupriavidus basilensis TaxID=68895 RepID=UPI00157B8FFE|nr:hypothetical protein [Cupriavidus basilensis]NUA29696.1 hypothetical protein [Cupriavidus basilensis]
MKTISNKNRISAGQGEAAIGKLLFVAWMALFVFPFTAIKVDHVRYPIWLITLFLVLLVVRRILRNMPVQFPSRSLVIWFVLAVLWRTVEVIRSPGEMREISIAFGDFLCVVVVCIFIVPNLFSLENWLRFLTRIYSVLFAVLIILSPYVRVSSTTADAAGADKGLKWLFVHPNVAAMFGMTIFLTSLLLILLYKQNLRWMILTLSVLLASIAAIIPTNARTTEGTIIAVMVIVCFGLVFGGLWRSGRFEVRALRYLLIITVSMVIGTTIFIFFQQMTQSQLDSLTTGRLFFWISVISTVPNIWLGVGFLKAGTNLLYDIEDLGAGIDGLYVNILYTDGIIGLALFLIVLGYIVRYAMSYRKREFPYLVIIPIAAFLYGLTETHFWLTPSPLTIAALGISAIISIKPRNMQSFARGRGSGIWIAMK